MSGSMLDKLLGSFKKKAEGNTEVLESQIREKLKGIVYDEALIDELLPTFMKLQSVEGFSKVVELLETKEKQIETITGGDWYKQTTKEEEKEITQEEEESEDESDSLVDSILKSKYEVK